MKLRIRGNSIRLRLAQSEVTQLAVDGRVESVTSFGSGVLKYAIAAGRNTEPVKAGLENNEITVSIPVNKIEEWATSEQVGIESTQTIPNGELRILIEKDFTCLKPRSGEDDADTFANPLAAGNA